MNPYVPWDTLYANKFLDVVRPAMGNATVIGILIFAIIFGLTIIAVILRWFR